MKQDAPYGNFGEEYAKDSRRHYYANVTFIDEEIGKVINTLKEKGIYDNALICYISDHGDMLEIIITGVKHIPMKDLCIYPTS